MNSGIYTITNLINSKMYLGYSVNLRKRGNDHFSILKRKNHNNIYLQRAVDKYGIENFIFEVLIYCDKKYLASEEHYLANLLNVHDPKYGYNIRPTHPENKTLVSKETREKMRKAHIGVTLSQEQRKKMSQSAKLKPHVSEKTKQKLAKYGYKKNVKILQYDLEDNFIKEWASIKEAAFHNKCNRSYISHCLTGRIKTLKNYKWKYKNK